MLQCGWCCFLCIFLSSDHSDRCSCSQLCWQRVEIPPPQIMRCFPSLPLAMSCLSGCATLHGYITKGDPALLVVMTGMDEPQTHNSLHSRSADSTSIGMCQNFECWFLGNSVTSESCALQQGMLQKREACWCSFSTCFFFLLMSIYGLFMPLSTEQVARDRKALGTETVGSGHSTGILCVLDACMIAHCALVEV